MNSQITSIPNKATPQTTTELATQLTNIGLRVTAQGLDDLIARATTQRWSPHALLEQIAAVETADKSRRSLERRLRAAHLGRFKPISDFDWSWPKKIDRPMIERALTLDFIPEARNLILLGANGLGRPCSPKTLRIRLSWLGTRSFSVRPRNSLLTCSATRPRSAGGSWPSMLVRNYCVSTN